MERKHKTGDGGSDRQRLEDVHARPCAELFFLDHPKTTDAE